jgi:hypothetical protein
MTAASDPRTVARLGLVESYRARGRTSWLEATGGSMGRSIPPGSRLLVEFGSLPERRGEVVVFRRGDGLVAHRVVRRLRGGDGERWAARGDNEAFFDPPLDEADVLGVVRLVRRADGRTEDLGAQRRRGGVIATVSWWSGRAAGAGTRVIRRVPLRRSVRAAAERALGHLSRVPTRVVSRALPRI